MLARGLRFLLLLALVGGLPAVVAQSTPAPNYGPGSLPPSEISNAIVDASKGGIPGDNGDLVDLETAAIVINARAGQCNAAKCPILEDCATAQALLQTLTDAQAYLEALETALNKGSAAAAAAHNAAIGSAAMTTTNMALVQEELAVQDYLTRWAALIFDLASLADDIKNMHDKGAFFPGDTTWQRLDTAYESLKDLEAVMNDLSQAGAERMTQNTPSVSASGTYTPLTNITTGLLVSDGKTGLANDLKSSISDAKNAIDELRKIRKETGGIKPSDLGGLTKALGKISFRALKARADKEIAERKQYIDQLVGDLTAEQRILANLAAERARMVARRDKVTAARSAIVAARTALISCLSRTCGLPSVSRPSLPDYYAPPAGMSPRDVAKDQGWGRALVDLNGRIGAIARQLQKVFQVKDQCTAGPTGEIGVIPGGPFTPMQRDGPAPTPRVETQCIPCLPIAAQLNRILDEIDFLRQEVARIEAALERARKLRVALTQKEGELARHEAFLQGLRDIVRDANASILAGAVKVEVGEKVRQDLATAQSKRTALVTELNAIKRELEQAEAERNLLEPYRERLGKLQDARRLLRERLRNCEEDQCRTGYFSELDTWINVIGNNPLDPTNPLGGTRTPTQDPTLRVASVAATRQTGENQPPGEFTITISRPAPVGGLAINFRFEGTATPGTDYVPPGARATIAAGQTSATVSIAAVDDTIQEMTETVQMVLLPGAEYTLGVPSAALMTITDDDAPGNPGTVEFAASAYTAMEGGGPPLILVNRTNGGDGTVSVTYTAVSGTATAGADFEAKTGTLTWTNRETGSKPIAIAIVDDTLFEGNEIFSVRLSAPTGGAVLGALSTTSVTIIDNDSPPVQGPCGSQAQAWQGNPGSYACSGSCNPTPSPQSLSVNGDIITVSPFHAGGTATFQGCGNSVNSQSSTLTYFGQSNHRATITRSSNTQFSASIVSSGGGTCSFTCSR
ncbi:hypothetical protein DSM104443_01914 [Usitatibacter rugosus]|uniref:Calx-beta domain-containing protein n=1 Tax=Usitatibacter rugosus TaxID=2732067 RepID=A0A6M4GWG5_9PROT|nr:Calx-beta domain-containing protein [Usitatibacter rugosus]QJR10844.1 hypothetical protein DSM104443_01914 [Usitatibacter rugosus]